MNLSAERHCCPLCLEEAVPERCPRFEFCADDYAEYDPDARTGAAGVRVEDTPTRAAA